jgi:YHS domain-containing protein
MQTDNSLHERELPRTACGGKLKKTDGFPNDTYNGELIYFCSQACWLAFQAHPDEFMSGQIEHPIVNE